MAPEYLGSDTRAIASLSGVAHLGEDLLIITIEFATWESAVGFSAHERLDVLALDSGGRLVVGELKRESDKQIHIQALTYAALVSGFTEEVLADVHSKFLTKRGVRTTATEALVLLRDHVDGELDPHLLEFPRIVLLAGEHPPQVITTVVWLTKQGLQIELREVHAYSHNNNIVVAFDQVYPTPGIEDLLLIPARKQVAEAKEKAAEKSKAVNAVRVIVENKLLEPGTRLALHPTVSVTAEVRLKVDNWVDAHPKRGFATWEEDPIRPLRWEEDGELWTATTLVRHIINEAAQVDRQVRGTEWWVTPNGLDLVAVAGSKATSGRDWTEVHELIDAIGRGQWASYGDIAELIGSSAMAVGQHVASCPNCPEGVHRVLTKDGTPSEGFRWGDPSETRSCVEVLRSEGLAFTEEPGKANQSSHLDAETLGSLAAASRDDL